MEPAFSRVGVVLAGGASSRFSGEKALAVLQHRLFYERVLDAVTPHVDRVIVVSKPTLQMELSNQRDAIMIEDQPPFSGKGPIAGIYSAMKQVPAEWYVVIAVDMPLMDQKAVGKLIECVNDSFDAIVPVVNERMQPLAAIYHADCLATLHQQLLNKQYRMIDFLDSVKTKYLTEEELAIPTEAFQNINDDSSYKQLLKEIEGDR
ncbi:molybdenum cofactor guanylyltransferase [Alkalicoccobacillus plakortidis]|uniref:Probable molybdenum cofactor guanylyltransferase n=1 Tax=Alkalicoccobacillus plakortidis TaxID=444060 RepID=A0ABT0XGA6_9BACI|nr:molybdenum cofactor guanylyltransferase [Alkalicoccobacillus plakortidis]MCM2674941.1 molybdenum cofactor guanylyltransferase [Alkalicoccobacillus plakortidis]